MLPLFHRAMLTDQTIEEMEQQVFVVFILFFIYRLNHISQHEKNQSKPLFKKNKDLLACNSWKHLCLNMALDHFLFLN